MLETPYTTITRVLRENRDSQSMALDRRLDEICPHSVRHRPSHVVGALSVCTAALDDLECNRIDAALAVIKEIELTFGEDTDVPLS